MEEVDLFRALCCLGVLLIHISGFYWGRATLDPAFSHLVVYGVLNEAVRYALFGFMFISGMLLTVRQAKHFRAVPFIGKRVTTVLVPYLAWVAIFFLVSVLTATPFPDKHNPLTQLVKALHGSGTHLKIVLDWLLFGTAEHLYYINLLFQMYLLFALGYPLITWLLATRRRGLIALVILFALYPLWVYVRYIPYLHADITLPYLPRWIAEHPNRTAFEWTVPFALGLFCGAYRDSFLAWVQRWRVALITLTVGALAALAVLVIQPWFSPEIHAPLQLKAYGRVDLLWLQNFPLSYFQPILRLIYATGITCLGLCWFTRFTERLRTARPGWMRFALSFALASFGIYLVHPLFTQGLRFLKWSYKAYDVHAYLYLVGVTAVVMAGSYGFVIGVMALGKRWPWLRWLPKLLFGT